SGEITVEAGKKVFGKRSVTPQNTVLISGKIDRDYGKTAEIDVNVLKILK
ncbi:MAG: NirD/YgiW/YdeI family stress tolerance protein, partial [Desulfovibrio sp.]|nr:NirD/YgiW/YdeI family stress tolerance protein [Desulfovibrio sp.]